MRSNRSAFTLIELLVVITILLLLTYFTISIFRNDSGSKMREAARIGQAAIMGARDRALYAKYRRGFRVLVDPTDTSIGTGFVYVAPITAQTYSSVQPERIDDGSNMNIASGPNVVNLRGTNVNWLTLWQTGMLSSAPRVRVPSTTGNWFIVTGINASSGSTTLMTVSTDMTASIPGITPATQTIASSSPLDIELEVANELMPNVAPVAFPSGVIIDLAKSSATANTAVMGDLMFSPRGMIGGPAAALGPIFFLLRDVRDLGKDPSVAQFDQQVLTLFPQTGHVAAYPVDPTDISPADGIADHPFYFAQTGNASGG